MSIQITAMDNVFKVKYTYEIVFGTQLINAT